MAALSSYALCQSACSAGWVACYSSAGLVAGTVTAGVGAPVAALACNSACGSCMAACASKFLAEGAAETAATGGVMGPVTLVGGAVVAAGGWFGRGVAAKAAGYVATRGVAAEAGTAVTATSAATFGATVATVMPWVLGAVTIGSLAYQGYQRTHTPKFPQGILVEVSGSGGDGGLGDDRSGRDGRSKGGHRPNVSGTVVGIAAGYVVVDFGDGALHKIPYEQLDVRTELALNDEIVATVQEHSRDEDTLHREVLYQQVEGEATST